MTDKKKMSVADILAAARKADSKGDAEGGSAGSAAAAETSAAQEPVAESDAPPAKPSTPKPLPKGEGRPSVADILAQARGEKQAKAKPTEPAKKPAAKQPAVDAGKPKIAPAATNKEKPTVAGPRDTASILAAARKTKKPGPLSKAEAAKLAPQPAAPAPRPGPPPMPAKPAYAKAQPAAKEKAGEDRRSWLGFWFGTMLGLGFSSLVGTTAAWSLGLARFMFPNVLAEPPNQFKIGFPGEFSPGFVETKFKSQFGVWVVNTEYNGQQQLFALSTVCTHLGCTPNWLEGEQKFKCPCHGSGFYKNGINFEGPAPRPLERYAIRVADDGQVEIDKSRKFQEEMGQWRNVDSFVTV